MGQEVCKQINLLLLMIKRRFVSLYHVISAHYKYEFHDEIEFERQAEAQCSGHVFMSCFSPVSDRFRCRISDRRRCLKYITSFDTCTLYREHWLCKTAVLIPRF